MLPRSAPWVTLQWTSTLVSGLTMPYYVHAPDNDAELTSAIRLLATGFWGNSEKICP